jgi:hypothetical protein
LHAIALFHLCQGVPNYGPHGSIVLGKRCWSQKRNLTAVIARDGGNLAAIGRNDAAGDFRAKF